MKIKKYKSALMRYAVEDGVFWASYSGVLELRSLSLFMSHPMPAERVGAVAHRVDMALTALPIGLSIIESAHVWPVDGCILCRPDQLAQVDLVCRSYAELGVIRIPFVDVVLACQWARSRAASALSE